MNRYPKGMILVLLGVVGFASLNHAMGAAGGFVVFYLSMMSVFWGASQLQNGTYFPED